MIHTRAVKKPVPDGRSLRRSVTQGGHRFVRVHVNTGEVDWDLMGSIGHELRHAIEILSNRTVTSTPGLHHVYLHTVSTGGFLRPFETDATVETGAAVRAEVQKYRRR